MSDPNTSGEHMIIDGPQPLGKYTEETCWNPNPWAQVGKPLELITKKKERKKNRIDRWKAPHLGWAPSDPQTPRRQRRHCREGPHHGVAPRPSPFRRKKKKKKNRIDRWKAPHLGWAPSDPQTSRRQRRHCREGPHYGVAPRPSPL